MKRQFITAVLGFLLFNTAQAALIDRGNGLIYDDVKNLTWMQDADYAHTIGYTGVRLVDSFGRVTNSVDPYGRMTWGQAMIWADSSTFGGYDDWRLPTSTKEAGFYGVGSELGYMFYTNLRNPGACFDGICKTGGYGLLNKSYFNMPNGSTYWTSAEHWGSAWVFDTSDGFEGTTNTDNLSVFNAWLVRNGDVASVPESNGAAMVPESSTISIFIFGLVGFLISNRIHAVPLWRGKSLSGIFR